VSDLSDDELTALVSESHKVEKDRLPHAEVDPRDLRAMAYEIQRRRLADWKRGMVVVWPSTDMPGIWISYDCDADVISQGTTPERAMEAILEAVAMIAKHKHDASGEAPAREAD